MTKTNLTQLAQKYGSDKGLHHGSVAHKYTYLYDLILDRYKDEKIDLLELGLAIGGPELGGPIDRRVTSPSILMWLEYFPRAHIFGFDISDFSHMEDPRFTFVRGDGGSDTDLQRLASVSQGFDVILDDASHASLHQQLAFKNLYPKLRPGGTYIIEDLQWQPPVYETQTPNVPKTGKFLVDFFELGEYSENPILSVDFMESVKTTISSYSWFPSFSGTGAVPKLFIIRKSSM